MKIGEAEKYLREGCTAIYGEGESGAMARMLLEGLTGYDYTSQLDRKNEDVPEGAADTLQDWLNRLQQGEPVQYILQKAWFFGLPLFLDNGVLIPRPETEELVDWIIKDARAAWRPVFENGGLPTDRTELLKILDVGTGSGCIALALKKGMPNAEVWGCDKSEDALNIARRNGAELNIRVDFQGVDFLDREQQRRLPTVDIIVSNPPYIPINEKASMHVNVVNYEPHEALFVPDDNALLFYEAIAAFGEHRLHEGGLIYLEIHEDLGQAVVELFERKGYIDVILKKDMQGKDRMVKACKVQLV